MRDDPPTLPGFYDSDSETSGAPRFPPSGPAWTPTWPVAAERLPPAEPRRTHSVLLGISLGANVGLIAVVLGLLFLGRAGLLSASGATNGSGPSGANSHVALSSPTLSPTVTPTIATGTLQVTPSQVTLGCANGQQTQYVVLANTGSSDVRWQAQISPSGDQAGISISPQEGRLRGGTSVTLRLQIQSFSGGQGQQGVVQFNLSTPGAGTPPSVSYTTQACGGG